MSVWKYKREIPPMDGQDVSFHPVLDALLLDRGYTKKNEREQFLRPNFDRDLHDPFLFSQMQKVVDRIGEAKSRGETVGIFGDYDADGVTSSVIIHEVLVALNIPVVVYIPEKIHEGHGLNSKALETFAAAGVCLLLTLDCGMTNHNEIAEAARRNIECIIIDHHHVPLVLPEAFAIINPKIHDETYPFRELCGAGTSFKVAQALYYTYLPEQVEQLKWLLDVVAIGTVADVMPLIEENRTIVKYGLIVLGKTRRVGLQEMFAVAGIDVEQTKPDAHTIGFRIAPRINAASRMAHAMLAHDLLMERDRARARTLALELDAHNVARQKISAATTEAVRLVAEERYADKKFIFAVDEHYPFGIVGLVAGRIANEYRKPTCVLSRGLEVSQGSFRSVPELNIIEAIEECDDLLIKFGGHAQAAGMTIKNEHLDAFYERFSALVEKRLANVTTESELCIDMPLLPEHVTTKVFRDLLLCAPFGEGNREPVFSLHAMRIGEVRFVGNGKKHLKMRLLSPSGGSSFDAIGFSFGPAWNGLKQGDTLDIAFQLCENTWNGNTVIQLKLLDMKCC